VLENLEMSSRDEKIAEKEEKRKVKDAQVDMKRKAKELEHAHTEYVQPSVERRPRIQKADTPPPVQSAKNVKVMKSGKRGFSVGKQKAENEFLAELEAEEETVAPVEKKKKKKLPVHIVLSETVTGIIEGTDGKCRQMSVDGKAKVVLTGVHHDGDRK